MNYVLRIEAAPEAAVWRVDWQKGRQNSGRRWWKPAWRGSRLSRQTTLVTWRISRTLGVWELYFWGFLDRLDLRNEQEGTIKEDSAGPPWKFSG